MSSNKRWSNVTRSGKLHYNAEQLAVAKAASALEYARSSGYPLVGRGNRWTMKGHDSMVFLTDGRWYWNSRRLSGRALDFIVGYEGRTLPEAVLLLNGIDLTAPETTPTATRSYAPQDVPQEKQLLEIPARSQNMRRSFSYLAVTRGIDYDIVRELVRQGRIFEAVNQKADGTVYHSVAFAGLDDHGVIQSISLRGCAVQSAFKAEAPGSNKAFPFIIPGRADAGTLYVFESAIDAMSHATLCKLVNEPWNDGVRVAMGGNNTIQPILRLLTEHPAIQNIAFCLDADEAGRKMTAAYMEALKKAGIPEEQLSVLPVPYGKDWNAYLQHWRSVVARYAELPTTEAEYPDLKTWCGRIHYLQADGTVRKTVAYCTPEKFQTAVHEMKRAAAPIVVETPQQLQALERRQTRLQNQIER